MEEIILKDPLTGLYHHNYFPIKVNEELTRAKRKGYPLCILFVDLDFFKLINDNFGHQVGDQVLQQFSEALKNSIRESDLLFRYGGDEFAVILPELDLNEGIKIAKRIKEQIENRGYGPSNNLKISMSVGISQFPIDALDAEELIKKADERSLMSKRMGRGKIIYSSDFREEISSISLSETRFAGREKELDLISRTLVDFINTNDRFIAILKGVKGVGLSRLLTESVKLISVLNLKTFNITMDHKDLSDPFPLIKAIIREISNKNEPHLLNGHEEIANLYIGQENIHESRSITMSEGKVLNFLYDLLPKISNGELLVITIDNAELITKRCIDNFTKVLAEEFAQKISLILTIKGKGVVEEIIKTLPVRFIQLDIPPLRREEVKTLLWQVLKTEPDSEFLDWIMAKTGGRPLYIDKMLKTLIATHKLFPGETHWLISENYYTISDTYAVPIAEDISYLSPREREVLEFCAAFNNDFSVSFISQALKLSHAETLEIFETLQKNGYVEEVIPYSIYRFTSSFLREQIYAQIPKEKRGILHFKIANELDKNFEETARLDPQVLYEHYIKGGFENNAIPYIELLIKNSISKREFRKAIRFIQRIFEIAEYKLQIQEKVGLLKQWGFCLRSEGEFQEALQKLQKALELATKYQEKYEEALVRLEIAWIQHELNLQDKLKANIDEIIKIGNQINNKEIIAKGMIFKALYYQDFEQNTLKAVLTYEEILPLLKDEENHEIYAKVFGNLGKCYSILKNQQKSKEAYERALYHAKMSNNVELQATILTNYGTIQFITQDVESSRKTFEKAFEIVRKNDIRHLIPHICMNLATIYSNYAEYSLAISYLEKAIDYAIDMKLEGEELTYRSVFHGIKSHLGDYKYNGSKLLEIAKTTKEKGYQSAFEKAIIYLVKIYGYIGDYNMLEELIKSTSQLKQQRQKALAEVSFLEVIPVYSDKPEIFRNKIEMNLNEAKKSKDIALEIGFSLDMYLVGLLSDEGTNPSEFNTILENAYSAKLITNYLDLLTFEFLFGKSKEKSFEQLKQLEQKMNFKLRNLYEIGQLINNLKGTESQDFITESLNIMEKEFTEQGNKYFLIMFYRAIAKNQILRTLGLSKAYIEKLKQLTTSRFNFFA